MDLGLAGAISGMGQGLERGLQTVQSGIVQQGLHEADQKFQTEKLKLQMGHADKLQKSSQDFTAGENLQNRQFQTTQQQQGFTHAEKIQQQAFDHAETESAKQINKMVELQKLSSDQAKAFHDDATKLSLAHIRATQAGIKHIVPQVDGTVAGVMSDGKTVILKDEQGNPIKGVKDVTKTTELLVGINKSMIEQYQRELTRNDLTLSPEERADIKSRIDALRNDSMTLLKGPTATPTNGAPSALKIPMSVAPSGQQSSDQPTSEAAPAPGDQSAVPSSIVKPNDPRSAIVGGLVPWATGAADYIRKQTGK